MNVGMNPEDKRLVDLIETCESSYPDPVLDMACGAKRSMRLPSLKKDLKLGG